MGTGEITRAPAGVSRKDRWTIAAVLAVQAVLLPWTAHEYDVTAFFSHAEGVFFAHISPAALWPYGSISLAVLLVSQLPILFFPALWLALPLRIALLKLPAWLADIGTAAIVRACSGRREDADLWALRYLVDPAVVFVTVFHGQNDALPNVFAVAGIALTIARRFELAALALGLGAGTKFYPAAFVPLLLVCAYRNGDARRCCYAAATFAATAAATLAPVLWGRFDAVAAAFHNNSFGAAGANVSTASLWMLLPHRHVPPAWPQIEQLVAIAVPVVLALDQLRHRPGPREVARIAMLSAMSIVLLNPGTHPPFYLWIAGPLVLYAAVAGDWLASLGGLALSVVSVAMQFCQEGGDEYLRLNFGALAHAPAYACVAPPAWLAYAALTAALFAIGSAYRRDIASAATLARQRAVAHAAALLVFALFALGIAAPDISAAATHFDTTQYRNEENVINTFALSPTRLATRGGCRLTYDGDDVIVYAGNAYAARFATASLGYTLFSPATMWVRGRPVAIESLPSRYENLDLETIDEKAVRITREFDVSARLRPYRTVETFVERPCTLIATNPVLVYRFDFAAAEAAAATQPLFRRLDLFQRSGP